MCTGLSREGTDVNVVGSLCSTALIWAATRGFSKCVEHLIEAGADVNEAGKNCYSAVTAAAMNGHSECVDLLTQAGADVNTALIWATKNNHGDYDIFARGRSRCEQQ